MKLWRSSKLPDGRLDVPVGLLSLSQMKAGDSGEIINLHGGHGLINRMISLGFIPGSKVTIVQNYGSGPMIARLSDLRLAIGRKEAEKIEVRLLVR